MMGNTMKMSSLAIALGAALVVLAGCKADQQQGAPAAHPPMAVNVIEAAPESVASTLSVMGQIKSSASIVIRSKVSGYLAKQNVVDGQRVTRNDVLFELDETDFNLAVEKAQAQEQVARATYDLADTEYQRVLHLFNSKAISKQELDTASANRAIKRAEYLGAQTVLKQERQLLADSKIRATFDGIVGISSVKPGDLIQAQSTSLVTLTQMDPLWVEIGVSETQFSDLFANGKADGEMTFTAGGKTVKAPISFQASEVDALLGTITLRAAFANADFGLTPGMFVEVTVKGRMRDGVVKVPQRAVMNGAEGHFVYVLNEGQAQIRPVVAAEWDSEQWVIEQGLEAGDQVIGSGHMKLRPGAPVVIKTPEPRDGAQYAGAAR